MFLLKIILLMEAKIEKDCVKAAKRFGDEFNKNEFTSTNGRVLERKKQINQ